MYTKEIMMISKNSAVKKLWQSYLCKTLQLWGVICEFMVGLKSDGRSRMTGLDLRNGTEYKDSMQDRAGEL